MASERDRDDHGRFAVTEAELETRRAQVIKLRVDGYGFREIAAKAGISVGQAYNDFKAVMDRTKAEADSTADQERQVSLSRIDRAIKVLVPMIDAADTETMRARIASGEDAKLVMSQAASALDAMDRLDKLEKRRAALLGLDAPTKVSAEVNSVGLDELDALRKAARANECSSSEPQKPPGESGPSS